MREIAIGDKRPVRVCRDYGLAASVLLRWRQEPDMHGETDFDRHETNSTAALGCQTLWGKDEPNKSSLTRIRGYSGGPLTRPSYPHLGPEHHRILILR